MSEGAADRSGELAGRATTRDALQSLVLLLKKWNPAINLVAPSTLPDVWQRHVADSAQLLDHMPVGARTWLDLGSGGGFPGLVVAILAREQVPDLRVELVESDQRKCVFLQTAAQSLGLSVRVTRSRIESLSPRRADVVSARALASLDQLCRYTLPHLAPNGICLFLKGATIADELEDAHKLFRFRHDVYPSKADGAGCVVRITELANV